MVFAPLRRRAIPHRESLAPKNMGQHVVVFVADEPTRCQYTLTPEERERFAIICGARWPMSGFAWKFWEEVAVSRGLDPETVIGSTADPTSFSALPFGHGKDWCWPMALKCGKPPTLFPHLHAVD